MRTIAEAELDRTYIIFGGIGPVSNKYNALSTSNKWMVVVILINNIEKVSVNMTSNKPVTSKIFLIVRFVKSNVPINIPIRKKQIQGNSG